VKQRKTWMKDEKRKVAHQSICDRMQPLSFTS